ncbi:MAG: RsmD family RNA methyltransferase, partial [Burkholderiales bacterium]|nr:RsmD family RNA methyltransferase [Burkholderiales bacterium]
RLQATGVEIVRGDGPRFLRDVREAFDCVFLDPPFDSDLSPQLLPLLMARLSRNGLVYVESPRPLVPPEGWTAVRSSRAGRVHYQLLGRLYEYGEYGADQRC